MFKFQNQESKMTQDVSNVKNIKNVPNAQNIDATHLVVSTNATNITDGTNVTNVTGIELSNKIDELVNKYGLLAVQDRLSGLSKEDKQEPLLNPDNQQFTAFPIKYQGIWDLYKKQVACFWKAEEIDFSNDYDDFMTLNNDEKYFVEMILAFFAASDGIVNFNLGERFSREVQVMEAQTAYAYQMMMENIHSETYSLMLDNIVRNPVKKKHLFNAIQTVPAVKMMADWAFKWINSSESFAHRVVAFAIVEGVFFSGMFAAVFWLKKYKNKGNAFMTGLITSNKFISRDEGQHCQFACEIYKNLNNKLHPNDINNIIKEAVEISQKFMTDALPCRLIGMNSDHMNKYIEYVGDRLLNMLGYQKFYNVKNPFNFMATIGLDSKANFFEERGTEYQDSHVGNEGKIISKFDEDDIDDLDF
jgi:ribonucleotide reductase beta subunit family protein with ferritin-like domain